MAAKKQEEKKEIDVLKHSLVPEHVILGKGEIEPLLKKYNVIVNQLPKIFLNDPAVKALGAKEGDVLKVLRKSQVAGTIEYYRLVVKS